MSKRNTFGLACCFIAAFFWGTAFIAQDVGAEYMPPFLFQSVRSFVGVAVLVPSCFIKNAIEKHRGTYHPADKQGWRWLLIGGFACGLALFFAAGIQQMGIANNTTSPGKDAFITALYMVFVPLLSLFLGKRSAPHVYGAVVVALAGLWMLCMGSSTITKGDIQLIVCSVFFAVQIIIVGIVVPHVDCVRLSAVQFTVAGTLSLICAFLFEDVQSANVAGGMFAAVYAGVFASGIAYTMQIVGQKYAKSDTIASLLLSLESVFAVLTDMLLRHATLQPMEIGGMVLIFLAVMGSQLHFSSKKVKTDT